MNEVVIKGGNALKVWETIEILTGEGRNAGRYNARIEDFINGGILITSPEFIAGESLLRNDTDVLVNITRDDAIYQFSSRIRQKVTGGNRSSILTPPRNIKRVQRRQFCRVQTMEKLMYALIDPSMDWDDYDTNLEWINSSTRDLSGGGMMLRLDDVVSTDQLLLLNIELFEHNELPKYVVAICRRVFENEDHWLAGVEFISNSRLAAYFSAEELKRLPKEATQFDNAAQDRLVTFTFNQQVELRGKGLL